MEEVLADGTIPDNFWDFMKEKFNDDTTGSWYFLTLARILGVISSRSGTKASEQYLGTDPNAFSGMLAGQKGFLYMGTPSAAHVVAVIDGFMLDAQQAVRWGSLSVNDLQSKTLSDVLVPYQASGAHFTFYPTPNAPVILADVDGEVAVIADAAQVDVNVKARLSDYVDAGFDDLTAGGPAAITAPWNPQSDAACPATPR